MNKKFSVILGLWLFIFGIFQLTFASTGDLPQIVIDPESGQIYVTSWYFQNTWLDEEVEENTGFVVNKTGSYENNTETWNIDESTNEEETVVNTWNENLSEFEQAIAWMYANWLTMYADPVEYRPNDLLTREQAAKIIWQLYASLWYSQIQKNSECDFLDKDIFDPTLALHINNVCQWGLFKWAGGKYLAREFLTKPQAMAVLMRMFEWKLSDETRNPRWELYYLKGRRIGIIGADESMWDYDERITRWEIALYVYRLKNIVTNEQLKIMSLNAINQVDWEYSNTNFSNLSSDLSALAGNIDASQDPELQEAVAWMHDNGLTIYNSVQEYKPFEVLTREQASKMIDKFAELFNLKAWNPIAIGNECVFSDIEESSSLSQYIENVCSYGYLKGWNWLFQPTKTLDKSQFVVALIRMLEGPQDETMDPRWTKYFERANSLGIVGPADAVTFDSPITRYEVALFFYRLKIKYQMLQNLNGNSIQNEIVNTVEWSTLTNAQWELEANIYISSNLIEDGNFEIGYVEIFGNRYKVVKTDSVNYFTNWLVWYGDLYDLVEDEKIGTVTFSLTNGIVIDGMVRNNSKNKNYSISKLENTSAYYKIREVSGE